MKDRVKEQMKEDTKNENLVMQWLKDPKMAKVGYATAAIAAILGLGKMAQTIAKDELRKDIPQGVVKHNPETPLITETDYENPAPEPEFNAEPEEDFEKQMRENEEEYWRLMSGENTHGEAGTDRVNYGKPGEGAPQLSKQNWKELEDIYKQVGHGMSMEDADELGYQLAERAGLSREQFDQLMDATQKQTEVSQQIRALRKAAKDGKTSVAWAMSVALRDGGSQR